MLTIKEQNRQKRFQKRLREQTEREQRGEPIHPEIASRLTKPKTAQPLFQVVADVKGEHLPIRCSPMMIEPACEEILIAVNAQISLGKLPGWGNTRIEPVIFNVN